MSRQELLIELEEVSNKPRTKTNVKRMREIGIALMDETKSRRKPKIDKIIAKGKSATTDDVMYLRNNNLTIKQIAKALKTDESIISDVVNEIERKEKSVTRKKSNNTKLKKALRLLETTNESVTQIARKTGANTSTLYRYISDGRITRPKEENKMPETESKQEAVTREEFDQLKHDHQELLQENEGIRRSFKNLLKDIEKMQEEVNILGIAKTNENIDVANKKVYLETELQKEKSLHDKLFEYTEQLRRQVKTS